MLKIIFNPFLPYMNTRQKTLFLLFFLVGFRSLYAQYTDVINSNKPGFSESPYSVGSGVYQFESNLFFRNTSIERTFTRPQSFGIDVLFRTSFFLERLELNTQFSYQKDKVAFKNIFTSHYFTSGFGKMTIGAKYLVFQQEYEDKSKEVRSWKRRHAFDMKRLVPSVSIYLGMNTDFVNDIYKTGGITPKVGLLLQNNLTRDFNVITNVYYDKIGSDFAEFSYIITATQNFSDQWSAFFENQTIYQKYQTNTNLGAGLAYLYNRDLQINASGRLLLEGKAQGFYAGLGVSYRINNHEDSYIELDENGQELKDTPITRYNKKQNSFFNRLFSIFKKKDKNTRTRPKRSRRSKTKNKKSGFFSRLFGKKETKAKKEETEIEKLEREIKELEEEMKKEEKKKKKGNN
ncbi:transporter [Polaribacter batillariae]|uniref:Transporter n=1 Tax=Polaribacter batillariae TaxID=2808900 RepID=A0ABX7SW48_9FLAO|nr:transporter [Polaribacter batillariae]QTD37201.1 transporter [Polaribacter batillariae]